MRLSAEGKRHLALSNLYQEMWGNPPAPFNPAFDQTKATKKAAVEKKIKASLDEYHKTLKRVPNDEYYALMDAREAELRQQFAVEL